MSPITPGRTSFGWRFNKYNKLQIEGSLLFGSHTQFSSYYYGPGNYYSSNAQARYTAGQDALTYSFVIPFDKKGVVELRLSPSIGYAYVHANFEGTSYYPSYTSRYNASEGRFAFMAGGGIGLTFHTSKRFMLDLGYRYMRMGALDYSWGEVPSSDNGFWTLLLGWKF